MLPILPIFTLTSFSLIILLSTRHPILPLLSNPWLQALGFSLMLIAWGLLRLNKIKFATGYDCFAFGSLLVWFVVWQDEYTLDKVIFMITPVLFTLTCVISTLTLIKQRNSIDRKDIELIFSISWIGRFSLQLLPFMILGSLFMPKHYLFYPVLVVLLIIRFVFESCLRDEAV